MRERLRYYIVPFTLSVIMLLYFNNRYKSLTSYSESAARQNNVLNGYHNLSALINRIVVHHPDYVAPPDASDSWRELIADSLAVKSQLAALRADISDSSNARISNDLNTLISTGLLWLNVRNAPDSPVNGSSSSHIDLLKKINRLILEGIERTSYLNVQDRLRFDNEAGKLKLLMMAFIIATAALLFYTTYNFVSQRTRRKQKESELETVLNRTSDQVISVDSNWRYTFLNDKAVASHPGGKKGTLGKVLWEVHPALKETVLWNKYKEAMRTKLPIETENYFPSADRWWSIHVYPSDDGITIFSKNITEAKKAQLQLAATIKEIKDYKLALDAACIVAITDREGKITHANENFCRISGYRLEELMGQDHGDIYADFHTEEFVEDLWTTITQGNIWKGELRNKAKDGNTYWVETTIVPFLDESAKPYQYMAIQEDVTERKKAEAELLSSEKIYKEIASSIPGSVICLLDRDFRYFLIEGDMLDQLEYPKEKLLGQKAEDVIEPDFFATLKQIFDSVLAGNIVTRENSVKGYDFLARYIPLRDAEDNVYAIMTVAIDVTGLKTAQRAVTELNHDLERRIDSRTTELKKSIEELDAFSYSVSHDLRAPLRGITAFAGILEEEYGSKLDAEALRLMSIIRNSALTMGRLIDDLLTFSRMGKLGLKKIRVDSNLLVQEVISMLKNGNEEDSVITWDLQELPVVNADINTLRQVWINLISNAVKYSRNRESPVIKIASSANDHQVVFYIRDNGAGFDEAYKDKLFRVFQRLHDADEFEGTGVGLAVVERIISRHNGKVWAEGKEDEGACFYFSLPKSNI